jgi:hypothetical protein
MKVIVEPDKVRFIDEQAREHRQLIHCLELSDQRSLKHFITVYLKGRNAGAHQFARQYDFNTPHDPAVFHRDDRGQQWIGEYADRQKERSWSHHLHRELDHEPGREDVMLLLHELSSPLWEEIQQYLIERQTCTAKS